jgi:hypothetical protein
MTSEDDNVANSLIFTLIFDLITGIISKDKSLITGNIFQAFFFLLQERSETVWIVTHLHVRCKFEIVKLT